jgi:hypothetical protein
MKDPSTPCVEKLQQAVLYELEQLNQPRPGIMDMDVDICLPNMTLPFCFAKQDLCTVIQNNRFSDARIYFSPTKYTPSDEGRKNLWYDLQRSANDGGDVLSIWGKGSGTKGKGDRQSMWIRCQCAPVYRAQKFDKSGSMVHRDDYRNTTYCNDRKNNRRGQKGRNASHRTTINRRVSTEEERCTFSLSVFHDERGYYIKPKLGSIFHKYHARRDHVRSSSSLLNKEDNQLQYDLNSARAKTGVAANLHFTRSGRKGTPTVLSRDQIKYLVKKNSNLKEGKSDVGTESGEIDDVYEFLKESGNYYVSLLARSPTLSSQVPSSTTGKGTLFNETRIGNYMNQVDVPIAAAEEQEMLKVVTDHRQALKISDSQEMMVGIAYAMPFELKQFDLFHVCMHIDATADSNKEGRPLVTLSSKDSYGKMFLILRCFMPSEQSWAYKWLFQTVLPALLGKEVLQKISIIVTDGDSQEIGQLEDAVRNFFPNAYRIRCSWHIIDRGWNKNVKASLGGFARKKRPLHLRGKLRRKPPPLTGLNKTARTIYRWMFSWAQPSYCETKEEYICSKALFLMFVQSKQVKDILGIPTVEAIIAFARENVFPHEDRFCYYKRHDLFHLETHTNCGHEGTNNGMKNCSSPVLPQNKLDRCIKTLDMNAKMKAANTSIMLCQKANSTKSWSDSPTAGHVTDPCESMLLTEWRNASDWTAYRVSQIRWLVVHRADRTPSQLNYWEDDDDSDDSDSDSSEESETEADKEDTDKTFGPLPRYSRVYEINLSEANIFVCSCCHQPRMGMPCRHVASVILGNHSILGDAPKGFPLSAVGVFWWNQYYLYGVSDKPDHQKTRDALIALSENDTKGVGCPSTINDFDSSTDICPEHVYELFHRPATGRLLNYDCSTAVNALQMIVDRNNPNVFQEDVPVGLSQRSHLPTEDENDSFRGEWDGNWEQGIEELSDDEEYDHTRKSLSREWNECTEAIHNSRLKQCLEDKFRTFLRDTTVEARASAYVASSSKGQRVSMLPASSKRQKTHGTKHY